MSQNEEPSAYNSEIESLKEKASKLSFAQRQGLVVRIAQILGIKEIID